MGLTPPTPRPPRLAIKGQGSLVVRVIEQSRSKNGPNQILIPVVGVSTADIYVTTPCIKQPEKIMHPRGSMVGNGRHTKM